MDVTKAVYKRKSIRSFLPTAVADDQLATLLTKAARAPSGGNVQPWRIYVTVSLTYITILQSWRAYVTVRLTYNTILQS